jgi:hypothetical protein
MASKLILYYTFSVEASSKLRDAKRYIQDYLDIPKPHVDIDRSDHDIVVKLKDPSLALIDKLMSLADNPMFDDVVEGMDTDGRLKKWQRNMPLQADNVNINFKWNHDLLNFPGAIKKAIEERRLDPDTLQWGDRIRVFQFDTGYSNHSRLAPSEAYDITLSAGFIDGENSGGKDNLKRFIQTNGHGTNTGFTVVATADETDGILREGDWKGKKFFKAMNGGLFPYCRFIPLRISKSVFFDIVPAQHPVKAMSDAMDHAVANGAHVIAMSMGGEKSNPYYEKAIKKAYENGILFVCASGQITDDVLRTGTLSPASDPRTIGVGGIETERQDDEITTHYIPLKGGAEEEAMDISAPAKWVYCAGISKNGDSFHRLGVGTSQSAAHGAAAAALWRQYWKDELALEPYKSKKSLIVEAFKWALKESKNIPDYWKHNQKWVDENKGILDAKKMLEVGLPAQAWLATR